ncbi:isochorismatase family protein [Lysinibacillus sp. OL1_EC]|uniref:cysteine hydrolase family protein n=1 Tax=unclassified Lysinibacillus TaxID=2636778 RepID=UPI00202ED987|nr:MULTISPECIES: isochorismatase family protein [unclassified Lysinibacillus]MCM0624494.1 isochorismatase family protein [Lysinibacillus sp. OL1_EC]
MAKETLIIVDISNDFVADHGSLTVGKPAQDIVPYIKDLENKFLAEGNVIVIAMDAHELNDQHFEIWPAHNIVDTEGQQLYGDLYDCMKKIKN